VFAVDTGNGVYVQGGPGDVAGFALHIRIFGSIDVHVYRLFVVT
jgi:hypothetical protein